MSLAIGVQLLGALAYALAAFALALSIGGVNASAGLFSYELGGVEFIAGSTIAAFCGAFLGTRLSESALRSAAFLLVIPLIGMGLFVIDGALRVGGWSAAVFGPVSALRLAEGLTAAYFSFFSAAVLRALSLRHRFFGVIEAGLLLVAFSELLSVHRHGAINRPFELADRVLSAGGDPREVLLIIGAVGATLLMMLLLHARSLRRSAAHLVIAIVALALIATSFPILEVPIPEVAQTGVGLRNEQRPRDGGESSDREELDFDSPEGSDSESPPIAVVNFHHDYSPETGVYFFRQASLSEWNGQRLVHSTRGYDRDNATGFPRPTEEVAAPPSSNLRTEVVTSVGLLADHFRPFGLESPVRFEAEPNPDPRRFKRTYRVVSQALTGSDVELVGRAAGDPSWSEEMRAHYLEVPDDPRYQALARSIIEEMLPPSYHDEPIAQIRAITFWLEREGTYTTSVGHTAGKSGDPTADFLFGDLVGYCVHFSHAATMLFRSIGLPARVSTGYAIPELARRGGSALLLTDAFSHAWAEVYLEGAGWIIADVQPHSSMDSPPPLPDADLTRLLGELRRGEAPERVPDEAPVRLLPDLETLTRGLTIGLKAILLTVLFVLFCWKWIRRIAPESPSARYRARLDRLSELGIRRRRGESPEAFARRVSREFPHLVSLTEAHLSQAFGGSTRPHPNELQSIDRALGEEIREAVSWPRRLLGALDPISWLFAR